MKKKQKNADSFQWKQDACPVWKLQRQGYQRCVQHSFHLGAHRDQHGNEWGPDRGGA